jgi:hypothetical protein
MSCRLCGNRDHEEDKCPLKQSAELEALGSVHIKGTSHPASKPFRDCRSQLALALAQREEDPARVWLELVSVRENVSKLPPLAQDDPLLSQDIERFRAKLEAEIFALTQEVGDDILAPLWVWVDLMRRRNKLDRDVLVARQSVKEARAARSDTKRAPRSLEETEQQVEVAQKELEWWHASCVPEPPAAEMDVWRAGGWNERRDALQRDPRVVLERGNAARARLDARRARTPPLGVEPRPAGLPPVVWIAATGGAALLVTIAAVTSSIAQKRVAPVSVVLAVLMGGVFGVVLVLLLRARTIARHDREAAVAAAWRFVLFEEGTRAMESEVGWLRALALAFKARRTFDESKAEGKQIEDLKKWRPDLRDFVVEVAKQGDEAAAAATLQSLRP